MGFWKCGNKLKCFLGWVVNVVCLFSDVVNKLLFGCMG